jgi:hypothetical protein
MGRIKVIKFPRGRYNGLPIVGFEVKFRLDLSSWDWRPYTNLGSSFGPLVFAWLVFYVSFERAYGNRD